MKKFTGVALLWGILLLFGGCENPVVGKVSPPEPAAPGISSIQLNRSSLDAETGGTLEFSVTVSISGDFSKDVTWELSGNTDPATVIKKTAAAWAVLTVGVNETATELTVSVTSTADSSKKASVTIRVIGSVPAGGKAWYVSAEYGDDVENDGLSKDSPLEKVSTALEAIKTAWAGDWPGKGTAAPVRAYIVIDGEIVEDMGGGGTAIKNRSSFVISSASVGADYPPIELRGWDSSHRGTLKAWTGKRVLYIDYNAVYLGPFLTLSGARITTTSNTVGGGVYAGNGSQVILDGTEIKDNWTAGGGGGVYTGGTAADPAVFTMERGRIVENQAPGNGGSGGGVVIGDGAVFNFRNGEISDNIAGNTGGGVILGGANNNRAVFNMTGGEIRGNSAGPYTLSRGGAVLLGDNADFKMTGGIIAGNVVENTSTSTTDTYGGAGVYWKNSTSQTSQMATFKIGGAARIAEDNDVQLAAYQYETYQAPSITICEAFTAAPAGPVATIDLAGQVYGETPERRWNFNTLFAWDEGLSGPLPLDRFVLGNFRRGKPSDYANPINGTHYVDPNTGVIRAKTVTVTNIIITTTSNGKPATTVDRGAYVWVTAVVEGEGNPIQAVNWSVNSTKSECVLNGSQWYLHVGADEDKPYLEVSATSTVPGIDNMTKKVTLFVPPPHESGQRAWYVSATGNDTNHGRTPEQALASPKKALEMIENVYRDYYTKNNWPKDGGGAEIPARIVISGEVTMTEAMAASQALAIDRDTPSRTTFYPALHFAGAGPGNPGTLRVAPSLPNTRAFWIRNYTVILGKDLTITGANISSLSGTQLHHNGGAVYVGHGGVLILDGADITGNSTAYQGGGVFVGDAYRTPVNTNYSQSGNNYRPVTFIFKSGSITGNHATGGGGGLSVSYNATVEMTGGSITGNTTPDDTMAKGGKDLRMEFSEYPQSNRTTGIFKIGGNAIVGNVQLQASQSSAKAGYTPVTITLLGGLPGSGTVIQNIDLASLLIKSGTGSDNTSHIDLWTTSPGLPAPVLTWDTGLSGSLPVGLFNLRNAVNGANANASTNAGVVTPLAGYHINTATGILTD